METKDTFMMKEKEMKRMKAMAEKGIYVCREMRNKTKLTEFTGEMGSKMFPSDTKSRD